MDFFYMIQAVRPGEYKIHKFAGGLLPDVTYKVTIVKNRMQCSCPSGIYRGFCKHTNMVRQYQKMEKDSDTIPILMIPY